jgi:alanine-alpha-ketoisovalerate/valine-pyruvate aminotransferase
VATRGVSRRRKQAFVERVEWLLDDRERAMHRFLGVYQSPQGDRAFREALAAYLRRRCGWDVWPEHIAVANGSQSAFFVLANLFAGAHGRRRRSGTMHLPLSPSTSAIAISASANLLHRHAAARSSVSTRPFSSITSTGIPALPETDAWPCAYRARRTPRAT